MSTFLTVATVLAMVCSALIGGIFFAFSNFVMQALERQPNSSGLMTMQTINVTVLNPGFLGAFMGMGLLSLALSVYAVFHWEAASSPYLLGGAVAYLGGTFLVTVSGNVPLNDKLAAVGADAPASEEIWEHYLKHWTRLNTQRTGAALLAAVLFSIGLVNG